MPKGLLDNLAQLRRQYHLALKSNVLFWIGTTVSVADGSSASSKLIANQWAARLPDGPWGKEKDPQTLGKEFHRITEDFLEPAFALFSDFRPGRYEWSDRSSDTFIYDFDQYGHLDHLKDLIEKNPDLEADIGEEYLVKPDIDLYRYPLTRAELGGGGDGVAHYSPMIAGAQHASTPRLLHAIISCKLTMRSDRAQNSRTEALQLIRHRKGRAPMIVAVTAEPLPSRLASLALGTGDLDCVYHTGLPELKASVESVYEGIVLDAEAENSSPQRATARRRRKDFEEQRRKLNVMVQGRRLRDVADLVVDLLQ